MINTSSSTLKDRRPWLVLAVGLLVTFAVTLLVKSGVERIAANEFKARCDAIQATLVDRVDDYARLIQKGAAFFDASEKVTREQWRLFNRPQGEQERRLPGILGIGFSLLIPPGELPRHLRELRSEGFPAYAVKPAGDRPLYSAIIYLEPFSGRNLRAFGYDMLSEPVRQAAMEQARDTNRAVLSGKVVLLQENGEDIQAGALMYLPVYHKGLPHETVAQRRGALLGWVYSPYRMGDLMQGILGQNSGKKEHIHLQLYDGGKQSPETLLYESHPAEQRDTAHPNHATRKIQANGRLWTLAFTQTGDGYFSATYLAVWLTMAGGVAVSLLLFSLGRSLLLTRSRAEALAQTMTRELRNSEERVNLILNTIGEAVYGIDLDNCCTFCNPAALLSLGYDRKEELLGKNMHDLIHHSHPDGSPFPLESCPIAESITGNRSCRGDDERFWRSDGTSFPVEYWAAPQQTEGGITGAVVTFREITRRKELEAEIRDAREYAENIVETVREPLLVLDSELKIITANQSFYATFRVTPEETVENFIYDLGNRQWDIPSLRLLLEDVLPNETLFNGYEVEHEFPGIGRKIILLNARQIFREKVGSHIILLAMEEITRRRELEAEIRDAREYAENIVETVREPLLVLDSDLKIITANQSFYATFRVTPKETVGNFIYDLGNRQWDIPSLRLLLEDVLPHETLFNGYEVEHEFPEIGRKIILLNAREIFQKKRGSHIILLAMEDITHRKEIEEELLLKDQEKINSLIRLAAGVAQEINTPLAFISSNLRVLSDYFDQILRFDRFRLDLDTADPGFAGRDAVALQREELEIDSILDDGADLISGTLGGTRRVTKIIQELKRYTQHKRLEVQEKEAITLERCLESALTVCRNDLKPVATVRKEYEPTPAVLCNQDQLSQVFLNLLLNAGQAMSAPGEIVLRSRCDELFVYVSVEDNGAGIPEELLGRIFDPFFTSKEVGKGTGLGLSISAEIVKKHEGELLVASVLGVGTTFTVKLPRTPEGTP